MKKRKRKARKTHRRKKYRIAWFAPDLLPGSGGHRTILKHASDLSKRGHKVSVYFQYNTYEKFYEGIYPITEENIKRRISEWGYPTNFKVYFGWSLQEPVDLLVATYWMSARSAAFERKALHKVYFVQDYEAYFNPMSDYYIFAQNSYTYGLPAITIGKWLAHKLNSEFGTWVQPFDFTADLKTYKPQKGLKRESTSVAFIYQPDKPRRGPVLGVQALRILKNLIPDLTVYAFGAPFDPHISHLNFIHQLGIITPEELANVYNRATVGLCISYSNPSRIPFEMMATGLPVVEVFRDNNLYDYPQGSIILAKPDPESVAYALYRLIKDKKLRKTLSEKSVKFMAKRNDRLAFDQVEKAVINIIEGRKGKAATVKQQKHKEIKAPEVFYFSYVSEQIYKEIVNPPIPAVQEVRVLKYQFLRFIARRIKKVFCLANKINQKIHFIWQRLTQC